MKNAFNRLLGGQISEDTEHEPEAFDLSRYASEFQEVALLVKALVEIVKVPVLDEKGAITKDSYAVQEKYQSMGDVLA
ncbi:MAG: hypothetical protein DCF25_15765 [Leptolyngbya foveolarum]|uniref:Uncharacterized protein n=1 Tax=Leptolyngbya foveolarum TaxID=47253 RepID=A0A2W4U101_9CYAN|nr:MAG: hypothetical protein DCF25_15765 [Leptolyngbya foveolarum]